MLKHILFATTLLVGLASAQPINVGTRIADSLAAAGYAGDSSWTMKRLDVDSLNAANIIATDTITAFPDSLQKYAADGTIDSLWVPGHSRLGVLDVDSMYWEKGLVRGPKSTYVLNPSQNHIHPDISSATILSFGSGDQPNFIGVANQVPVGDDFEMAWEGDTDGFQSSVAVLDITAGYDGIVNSVGSYMAGSHHSMVGYGIGGHNSIFGGSYGYISGASTRSVIISPHVSQILNGSHGAIVAGSSVEIGESAGRANLILGSRHSKSDSGAYIYIVSAESTFVKSERSGAIGTERVTVRAMDAIALGASDVKVDRRSRGSISLGTNYTTYAPGVLIGVDSVAGYSATSAIRVLARGVTTSSGNLTLIFYGAAKSGPAGAFLLPDSSSGFGRLRVIGFNITDGTQVAYQSDIGFFAGGGDAFLFKDGEETAVSSSDISMNLDLVSQTNNAFTPSLPPRMTIFAGGPGQRTVAARVTGVEGKEIVWMASFDIDVLFPYIEDE